MSFLSLRAGLVAGLVLALVGCPTTDDDDSAGTDDDDSPVAFAFWSTAFDDGDVFPQEYECDNTNPEIRWEGVPDGTVSLALIFDDPTAGGFPHWAIYNMAPDSTGIPAGASGVCGPNGNLPTGSEELVNGFGGDGYLGSCCCGCGPNTYQWRLWALNDTLDTPAAGNASTRFRALANDADSKEIEQLTFGHTYGPATAAGCGGACAR